MKREQSNYKTKYMNKIAICSVYLFLFVLLSSTIVIAASASSEENKALKIVKAPENPLFANNPENQFSVKAEVSSDGEKKGHKEGPLDFRHLTKSSNAKASFPAKYDLRTQNRVTPIKDQGKAGTCWAFATYGSLESYFMPTLWDFSENNLKNVLSNAAPLGYDFPDGGNAYMATAYLARWSGPVKEKDDPYILPIPSSFINSELKLPTQKHVQNVHYIKGRTGPLDNNKIKSTVMEYGAMDTSIYMDQDVTHSYLNPTTYSYYYDLPLETLNHDVAIVGWDDDYDKNKFSKVPPGNGAFIVRNSWGTNWGDKGYFYVSYYDSSIGIENAMFTAEATNDYSKIYQFDPLGETAMIGFLDNNNVLIPTAWIANIFTASSSSNLAAVSFYTTDTNCNYEIYINSKVGSSPNNQVGLIPTMKGTFEDAGYHTVKLKSGIKLKAGQKFSVVIKLTNPNFFYPIALEYPIPGYSTKATASPGESFVSPDGITWQDIISDLDCSNTNVCIKAFCS